MKKIWGKHIFLEHHLYPNLSLQKHYYIIKSTIYINVVKNNYLTGNKCRLIN